MNAPEKIYIDTNENLSDSILYAFTKKDKDDDIEYIRTGAFIEKACEWLKKKRKNYSSNALGEEYLIDDFKKAMKGE